MAEPTRFPTVESVLTWLESIPKFSEVGVKAADFGLDRMIDFCRRMGDPHLKIPAIHVAGTNGKGTTSQMLASMFSSRSEERRVGKECRTRGRREHARERAQRQDGRESASQRDW